MSTATEGPGQDEGLRELLASIAESYRYLEMPIRRYLLLLVLPSILFTIGAGVVAVRWQPPLIVSAPLVALGLVAVVFVVLYPKILADQQAKEIRQRFHLFLTHITVLSMTNIDRVEIFRNLAEVEEYEALAEEMGHLVALVETWNQSLEDAARIRSKQTPSPLLTDFLERLAYAIGGGQNIDEFLLDEQESNINQFVIRYESDLERLGVISDLYLSMVLSATFVYVFAIIAPMLLPVVPIAVIAATSVMYLMIQGGFVYAVHTISPDDPIWHIERTAESGHVRRVVIALLGGGALSLIATAVVAWIFLAPVPGLRAAMPRPLWLALPATPLILPGGVMRQEEQRVIERDEQFPAFIRALGAVESVKQTSTADVLDDLRRKDFGALTENVEKLYRRLRMRIDPTACWHLFSAETGSYLIQKFGDMYVVGRRMGGEPRELAAVISNNLSEAMKVRTQRQQETTTLMGTLYGATAASSFALFVGLEVVKILSEIAESIDFPQQSLSFLLNTGAYPMESIRWVLLATVIGTAALSALMIKLSDRGHLVSGLFHFVLLLWTGMITATLTRIVIAKVAGGTGL